MARQLLWLVFLVTTDSARITAHSDATSDALWENSRRPGTLPADPTCMDTDNGITNALGNGCSQYGGDQWGATPCGFFDAGAFKSNLMCCACGGGEPGGTTGTTTMTTTTGPYYWYYYYYSVPMDGCTTCALYGCNAGLVSKAGLLVWTAGVGFVTAENEPCSRHVNASGWLTPMCTEQQCCRPEARCEQYTCGVGKISTGHGGCGSNVCSDSQCCQTTTTTTSTTTITVYPVKGRITDATDMSAVAGAEVVFTQGEFELRLTVDSSGYFDASEVPAGDVTMSVTKRGYINAEKTITINGPIGAGTFGDISMSPVLAEDGWRVVLTWNADPPDLDSWTYFGGESVSYNKKAATSSALGGVQVTLDVDDRSSYGPETTTFSNLNNCQGKISCNIIFKVHYYTSGGSFGSGSCGAVVKLYNGATEVNTYQVGSSGFISGGDWYVFKLDGLTSQVTTCTSADCA